MLLDNDDGNAMEEYHSNDDDVARAGVPPLTRRYTCQVLDLRFSALPPRLAELPRGESA